MALTVWRIAKARYRKTHWSGSGGLKANGRWTREGQAVIYTASSQALAQLECLTHFPRPSLVAMKLVIASAQIPTTVKIESIIANSLPVGWASGLNAPTQLQVLGDRWLRARQTAVLCVPSAISRTDVNYLINPAHPDSRYIEFSKPHFFSFDSRLTH